MGLFKLGQRIGASLKQAQEKRKIEIARERAVNAIAKERAKQAQFKERIAQSERLGREREKIRTEKQVRFLKQQAGIPITRAVRKKSKKGRKVIVERVTTPVRRPSFEDVILGVPTQQRVQQAARQQTRMQPPRQVARRKQEINLSASKFAGAVD